MVAPTFTQKFNEQKAKGKGAGLEKEDEPLEAPPLWGSPVGLGTLPEKVGIRPLLTAYTFKILRD